MDPEYPREANPGQLGTEPVLCRIGRQEQEDEVEKT